MNDHPLAWANKYPDTGFPPWADAFINWLLLPRWERVPKTQSEFAREWKKQPADVSKIKHDDRFRKELSKRADQYNLHPERIQEVMNALYESAVKGDTKAMALYLTHAQAIQPSVKRIVIEDERIEKLSDEELAALIQEEGLLNG